MSDSLFCHNCGHRVGDPANFCSSCGAALRPEATETTVTLQPVDVLGEGAEEDFATISVDVPRSAAILVVRRGPEAGSRFTLGIGLTWAGRHPESGIFLDDITVSRRHVSFERSSDGSVTVKDNGSLNGTYVNRERIDEVQLHPGDEVQIGKYKLVFLTAGD
jgi:hypothetical protein